MAVLCAFLYPSFMRVGDGQLRLVGNRFAAGFIAFTHYALFLHACGCHFAFCYRPCRAGAQFFIAFAQNAFFVALAVWRDAVELLRLAVDVFLLGVLAVVLLLELAAFSYALRSCPWPDALWRGRSVRMPGSMRQRRQ